MSSPFSHLSRSVTRSGSSVTRGLFSAWSSSRHDGQPHKADDRRRRTSCESKTLQAQSNAIAAPIRRAFIFNQLMHALLLSFCQYFAKIADARGAISLSLVKCQVKKFLSAACPQGACVEAPFCVTMTVAIEFHSRALIRAHVRSRRHFAKLPLQNSREGMIGDGKDFSGTVCLKWKDTEFERQVRSGSLIPRGDASHAESIVSNRSAAEGALLEHLRSRKTPQEVLILCSVT